MRFRTPVLAGALCLAYAAPAYACNFYFASTFLNVPARPTFGLGAAFAFDPTVTAVSGDLAMKLGEKAVVRPGIGLCSGGGESDPFFGAAAAFQLTSSASMTLNLQTGISYLTYDGGNEMVIPVGAAASFAPSGNMSLYAGASMWFWTIDNDLGGSASDSDPVVFGGAKFQGGPMAWTIGGQALLGDDTDFGLVVGVSFAPAASAIRHMGSVLRK